MKSIKIIIPLILLSILFGLFLTFKTTAQVTLGAPLTNYLRVANTGSDVPNCGSDTLPCRTLQYAAYNRASSGDVITVAGGTYTYQSNVDLCSFLVTRSVLCFVDKHLTIIGGYTTGNWNSSNPTQNLTIIDGQNSYRGVAIVAYNSTAGLNMEGFTIQNGRALGASSGSDFYTYAFGGGMWAQNSAVVLKDIIFRNNSAIGGNTNAAYGGGGAGGALAIQSAKNGAISDLENVTFENNLAQGGSGLDRGGVAVGGGLFTFSSQVTGNNLTLSNNLAQGGNSNGNGTANYLRADALGGGAGFQGQSYITFSNISVSDNSAVGGNAGLATNSHGGGGFGGGISAEESTLVMTQAQILENQAIGGDGWRGGYSFGGGILTDKSDATLDRLEVVNNQIISGDLSGSSDTAGATGGGIYLTSFNPLFPSHVASLSNSIISGNEVWFGNPGNSNEGGGGGGLVIQALTANIEHITLADNLLGPNLRVGQAILVQGLYGTSGTPANATIRHSIISDHFHPYTTLTSAVSVAANNTATLDTVMFYGNTNDTNSNYLPYPPRHN